jgi:hypothetical protein
MQVMAIVKCLSAGASRGTSSVTLMADLTGYLDWMRSQTCSDHYFIRIPGYLERLVAEEMQSEET